ncbi:MAG TPA: ABC transporter ATP-binding protein, partial [Thermoanaerobaculia bacterium]
MSRRGETPDLAALAWPAERLGDLLEATSRAGGLAPRRRELPPPAPAAIAGAAALGDWLERAAGLLGLEAEPAEAGYREVAAVLRRAGPAVVRWPAVEPCPAAEPRFLGLAGAGRRGGVRLVAPDRRPVEVSAAALATALTAPLEAPLAPSVDALLERTAVPPRRRRRARRALLERALGSVPVEGLWQLRPPPAAPLPGLLATARVLHRQAAALAAHLAGFGLFLAAWYTVGR